jgi:hypothetical protein
MMIGVLDPALLLPRPGDEDRLEAEIDAINQICRSGRITLPKLEEYWPALWQELGVSLQRTLKRPRAKLALDELRNFGCVPKSIPTLDAPPRGRMLGARHMFEIEQLSPTWLERMTLVLARASASGIPAVLLTRRMIGRNLQLHQAENSRLEEVTRWVLYVSMGGDPPRAVYCVHHPRNLPAELRWTTRYDWRLPSMMDGAHFPFCPPDGWWKGKRTIAAVATDFKRDFVEAIVTMNSKPAFLDAKGNGWARPNIEGGKGYHWDVYIRDAALAERVGLDQLNIVEFGAPPKEGAPGTIHHIPAKKKAHLRDDTGWTC